MTIDSDWIQATVDQYEHRLIRYASSILGDLEKARDAVQDTFLRLCKQEPEKLEGHLAAWLFRVCRNRALDMRRREDRMKLVTEKDVELKDRSPGPSATLQIKESLSQVSQLMAALSENQQEVIRLKFQTGMSYKEISTVTGLSVSNVGFLLHTAIQALRTQIQAHPPTKRHFRRIK